MNGDDALSVVLISAAQLPKAEGDRNQACSKCSHVAPSVEAGVVGTEEDPQQLDRAEKDQEPTRDDRAGVTAVARRHGEGS